MHLCTDLGSSSSYLGKKAFLISNLLAFGLTQVAGYAVGGGHILHMVCDLTIAADNAIFGQTGPKVLPLASVSVFNV